MSIQQDKLKAIADAIRLKKRKSELIAANDFASEILSIETGITPSGTIEITENGTYDVTEYASASVNVASVNFEIYSVTQTINEDGTCNIDIGEDGTGTDYAVGQIIDGELCSLYIVTP